MNFKTIGNLAKGLMGSAQTVATDAAMKAFDLTVAAMPRLDSLVASASERLNPVAITMTCSPTGTGVDDYEIYVDHTAFMMALMANRFVRPNIVVRAANSTLDRDLLAKRMEEALAPVLTSYEEDMQTKKKRVEYQERMKNAKFSLGITFSIVDFFTSALVLALIGAGALVGPLFWLTIGLGGLSILPEIPNFLWGTVKYAVFGSPIDQLEKEAAQVRGMIVRMVRTMKVEVDPTLTQKT